MLYAFSAACSSYDRLCGFNSGFFFAHLFSFFFNVPLNYTIAF